MRWMVGLVLATLGLLGVMVYWTARGAASDAGSPPAGPRSGVAGQLPGRPFRAGASGVWLSKPAGRRRAVVRTSAEGWGTAPGTERSRPVMRDSAAPSSQPGQVVWAAERRAGRLRRRLDAARAALRDDPYNTRAWQDAIDAVRAMGDQATLLQLLAERARRMPDDAIARRSYGAALLRRGRLADAARELAAATRRDPTDIRAWIDLAQVQQQLKRLHEAAGSWQRVLELAPDHAAARVQLGLVQLSLGQWKAAEQTLRAAVAARPEDREAVLGHAQALWALGHSSQAMVALQRWLDHRPHAVPVLVRLAQWHAALYRTTHDAEHRTAAIALARRALVLAPQQPQARALLEQLAGP